MNGLFKIDINKKTSRQFKFEFDGLTNPELRWHNSIRCMARDSFATDLLWLGTNEGLIEFNQSTSSYKVHYYQGNKDAYHNIINTIVPTQAKIYVGSKFKGWFVLDREKAKSYQIVPDTDPSVLYTVTHLHLDKSNNLWISSPQGLKQFAIDSKTIIFAIVSYK